MITKFKLPKFDNNMEEGTVGVWFKSEGDKVCVGDALVEVITDKTTYEVHADNHGALLMIISPERSIICPGFIMALIGDPSDELPDVSEENQELMDKLKSDELSDVQPIKKRVSSNRSPKVRATPTAKRIAIENNIELEEVRDMFDAKVVNERMVEDFLERKV